MRNYIRAFMYLAAWPAFLIAQAPQLTIHVNQPISNVSPMLYGLMTEEINFSLDGGLYPEMVRDRTIGPDWQALAHWNNVERGDSVVDVSVDEHAGPSDALPRSLKVKVTGATDAAPAGVENDGYWGMAVRPQTNYVGSFYAKADTTGLPVTVSLVNDNTGETAASAVVSDVGSDWKKFDFTLKTDNVPASSDNHLLLTIPRSATIWFGLVSLFPPTYRDRPFGTRIDLMEKLATMHPRFLRLPGGNYLEGDHIPERFDWKKTIGPWIDRPTHQGPWQYRSSDGMGLLEFLEWCEDLKIEPVLAVYDGYSLAQEHVEAGPALDPYVQDALDEIEYVTGDTTSRWGAERARDGHPAPFPLHYVEIGNEDFFDKSGSYEGRFPQFFNAIKQKYPKLQLIATAPVKSIRPDVLDEHFYMTTEQAFADTNHYDKTDRDGPKIMVGEWATLEGETTPNLEAALADAAWMTGLERNSDVVVMASYAPLFVNVNTGASQWVPDLIGYNALSSYGSPSYWAQAIFANHLGTEVVASSLEHVGPRVYASVTRDKGSRRVFIKLVNASSGTQNLTIALDDLSRVKSEATLTVMSGKSPNASNTISDPDQIIPMERPIHIHGPSFAYSLPPYSISTIDLAY